MENQQKPKTIEGIFPNDLENSEAQNDLIKLNNWKNKLIEMIWYKNRVNTDIVLAMFQQ